MSRQRYVIEGTWRGYHSSQDRIVHREVTTDAKLAVRRSRAAEIKGEK